MKYRLTPPMAPGSTGQDTLTLSDRERAKAMKASIPGAQLVKIDATTGEVIPDPDL